MQLTPDLTQKVASSPSQWILAQGSRASTRTTSQSMSFNHLQVKPAANTSWEPEAKGCQTLDLRPSRSS